jgi:hypothetical protein
MVGSFRSALPRQLEAKNPPKSLHVRHNRSPAQTRSLAQACMSGGFSPCLWVQTEREIADQIFIAATFGVEHFRAIWLPETITTLPPELELRFVALIARTHFKRSSGELPHFGGIRGYLYIRRPNQRWTLDVTGKLIDRHGEEVSTGKYNLRLKGTNRDISSLFRKRKS